MNFAAVADCQIAPPHGLYQFSHMNIMLAGSETPETVPDTRGGAVRIDQLFARSVAADPAAIALIHQGREISYAELDTLSDRNAHRLAALGVGPGTLVGVCLERSPDLVVSLLAILKAGGAYVPLDPAYPAKRLEFMLRDTAAPVLISRGRLVRSLDYDGKLLDLDQAIPPQPAGPPPPRGSADDLAYVIYTSGSTGQPKGVMLRHSIVRFFEWAQQTFRSGEMARVAATASICFDPSVFELFAPLCTGGAVILKEDAFEPFGADERPTMLQGVPSVFAKLARAGSIPDSVRVINVGGEVLDRELVEKLYRVANVEAVYNHYGPTETTTCATVALVARGGAGNPPIGRPIGGARVYVLDDQAKRVRPGLVGELHIAGDTVADGYLGREALTAACFLADPFHVSGGRMYRTGDLGRMTTDGDLEFVGRHGDQIKLRGVRIELGEVEAALIGLSDVRAAAVALRADKNGRDCLVAYVVTDRAMTLRGLRQGLRSLLPDCMLPSSLVIMAALPLTLSGKVDRGALPDLDRADRAEPSRKGPFESTEQLIIRLFEHALNVSPVRADDNFYEIGGDSLLAVDVALELETALGQPVPAALLAHAATPAILASALDLQPLPGLDHLTMLQPLGELPPLFCMSGVGGRPTSFISLARHFAPHQPVYNISIGGLWNKFIANPSIAVLTKAYLAEIRAVQPRGPYRISGYSFAGIGAFDLACALEALGEDVTLILLDCNLGRRLPGPRYLAKWAARAALSSIREIGWRGAVTRALRLRRVVLRRAPDWLPNHDKEIAASWLRAKAAYRFKKFGGRSILVSCKTRTLVEEFTNFDGMLGWRGLLDDPLVQLDAQIDHGGLMSEPYVEHLAGMLSNALSSRSQGMIDKSGHELARLVAA